MTKYPFDQQVCSIDMVAMNYNTHKLDFVIYKGIDTAHMGFFTENNIWALQGTKLESHNIPFGKNHLSTFSIIFTIKRRPSFVVMNIILPVVFLALLNILVFLIPVESGEKIGFGITCLLALAVFLSIIRWVLI